MVPMVASAAEARTSSPARAILRSQARRARSGSRTTITRAATSCAIAALHERTLVIAQIETDEGLSNGEAIAAVPGVDALWIGQFDLTNFMGFRVSSSIRRFWPRSNVSSPHAQRTADGRILPWMKRGRAITWPRVPPDGYGIDQSLAPTALQRGLDCAARCSR